MHGSRSPIQNYREFPTARQRQIMRLAARGLSNKQIGRELNISEGTVKTHLHQIYDRLGIRNRTALVAMMLREPDL